MFTQAAQPPAVGQRQSYARTAICVSGSGRSIRMGARDGRDRDPSVSRRSHGWLTDPQRAIVRRTTGGLRGWAPTYLLTPTADTRTHARM